MRKFKNGKTIYPQWEDINNKDGGYWSFKVDNADAQEVGVNYVNILLVRQYVEKILILYILMEYPFL